MWKRKFFTELFGDPWKSKYTSQVLLKKTWLTDHQHLWKQRFRQLGVGVTQRHSLTSFNVSENSAQDQTVRCSKKLWGGKNASQTPEALLTMSGVKVHERTWLHSLGSLRLQYASTSVQFIAAVSSMVEEGDYLCLFCSYKTRAFIELTTDSTVY